MTFTAENGNTYVYTPDGNGGFIPPEGARSTLAEATNPSGTLTGYTLTDPSDHVILAFSTSGQLESEDDATGQGLTFTYNSSGEVDGITDAARQSVTLTYDGSLLSQVALPDGQDISYGYNSAGELTSVTGPGSEEWQYTYNPSGLLAIEEDPNLVLDVQNTYNSSGQVTGQEAGNQNYTYFSYTMTSGSLSETDVTAPDGGITTYLYGGGMLERKIGPVDNATANYMYTAFGDVSQATDPLGRLVTYEYDDSGDLTEEDDNLGNSQYLTYDNNGNVLTYQNWDGNTATYTYNSMNEVLTAATPDSEETQDTYNPDGSLASEISARGHTTTYA